MPNSQQLMIGIPAITMGVITFFGAVKKEYWETMCSGYWRRYNTPFWRGYSLCVAIACIAGGIGLLTGLLKP